MPEVIVIADDLSGAADTGVAFVKCGYQTLVIWDVLSVPPVDVLVFSTESRHIPRDQAVAKVRAAVSQLSNLGDPAFIYKKIDSTLRGHPAAELAVVMNGFDIAKALVAPAFPAQKRVTVSGIHYIDGLPLDQTTFGKEVATANVCELFRDGRARNDVVELGLDIVRMGEFAITQKLRDCTSERIIAVADAETMEDLSALVRAGQAEGFRLYCGSAGLAGALAQTLTCKDTATQLRDFKYKGVGILGVIASRRDNTLRQIAFAKANGIPVVCPDMAWFTNPQASVNPIVRDLQRYLSSDGMALVTAHELPFLPGKSALICTRLAEVVSELMTLTNPSGLVLTGGAIAIALSTMLEAHAILLCGEVKPGIPWGHLIGGSVHGCLVVTKAGGFGEDTALVDAMEILESKK